MTKTIQFTTKVNQGTIVIPQEYTEEIQDNLEIEVIIKPKKTRLMDKLAQNPLKAEGWRELSRDDIHDSHINHG